MIAFGLLAGCKQKTTAHAHNRANDSLIYITRFDQHYKTIHVIVALCDNKYQGIVPVPAKIGNGHDPENNLYWGNEYGVRTYFKTSSQWKLIRKQKIDSIKLERLVFKHIGGQYYLIADAYNGKYIKNATRDFLYSCSGQMKDTVHIDKTVVGINGNSNLVAYIGHDGLMDFQLPQLFVNEDGKMRECMILACTSKKYFAFPVKAVNANPLLWTNELMCPEAYTLHDAITGYINSESPEEIRMRAIKAYSKYQKCTEKSAGNILVTGW